MLLNDAAINLPELAIDRLDDFMNERMKLVERLMMEQDKQALTRIILDDKTNISSLQAGLKALGETIANFEKVQQYASVSINAYIQPTGT